MSRSKRILGNVASNWVGVAVNALVTLMLTPYVLRELGVSRYGVWILTSSIVGYYGFLDLGFRAGVTQYLTRYLALRDYPKASECLSSAVTALSAFGVVLVGLSILAAWVAPRLFGLPPDLQQEAFWCILIVGCSSAVQFGLSPYTSIFTATQRFDLATLIGVITRLLTAAGIVFSLRMGYGLIGVSLATCAVSVCDYVIRWRVSVRIAPGLEFSRSRASLSGLREVGVFGAWNFLISANAFVFQHVPNILIAAFLPIAAVGHYALTTGLLRQINSLLSPLPQVLYPAATQLHVQGNLRELERLYHDGSRLTILVMIPLVLGATFWAGDFYRLWIGESFLTQSDFPSVALLLRILLVTTAAMFTSSIAQQILIGAGRVNLVAVTLICGSAISLTLAFLLVGRYGLVGVAVATVVCSLLVDFIAMPLMLDRVLGLSVVAFIRNSCVRPLIAGVFQALLMAGIRLAGGADSWPHLALQGILAAAGSLAVLLAIGVTGAERQRFIVQPLRRLVPGS